MPTHSQPERIGKYEILSVLGRGGMGIVYKARDPVIDRIVAVKTISVASQGLGEDQVERLLMEARSAGRLHHPNIVTVFDFGQEGDLSYIVMEYAEGLDLGQVIAAKMPLALSTKIDLLLQICNGLDTPTTAASRTATSSRPTCASATTAPRSCSTSAWPASTTRS